MSLRDRRADCIEPVAATAVFVMIGAVPCSEAAVGMLALDPAGYLLCGTGAASCDGHLACAVAVRFVHDLLAA